MLLGHFGQFKKRIWILFIWQVSAWFGPIWTCFELFKILWTYLLLFGPIRTYFNIITNLNPPRCISTQFNPFGLIWTPLHLFEPICHMPYDICHMPFDMGPFLQKRKLALIYVIFGKVWKLDVTKLKTKSLLFQLFLRTLFTCITRKKCQVTPTPLH